MRTVSSLIGSSVALFLVGTTASGQTPQFQGQTSFLKTGCTDVVQNRSTFASGYCTGVVTEAMELYFIFQDHWLFVSNNVCVPANAGLNTGDFIKLVDQKSYLIRANEPVILGIVHVLADAFRCSRR